MGITVYYKVDSLIIHHHIVSYSYKFPSHSIYYIDLGALVHSPSRNFRLFGIASSSS
jgi:hypothetical protein